MLADAESWAEIATEYGRLAALADRQESEAVIGSKHCPVCFHFFVGPTCGACHLMAHADSSPRSAS
jgi:hypothetical protein